MFKRRTLQVILFSLFLFAMLLNMGLSDRFIEDYIKPEEFTILLTKIVGVYTVHLAVMLGCFFNSSLSEGNVEMTGHSKTAAIVILILSVCWNFMITITVINYSSHLEKANPSNEQMKMTFEIFGKRLDNISGAINFLIAGGLAYFFSLKPQDTSR